MFSKIIIKLLNLYRKFSHKNTPEVKNYLLGYETFWGLFYSTKLPNFLTHFYKYCLQASTQ